MDLIAARCRTPGYQITAFYSLWVCKVLVQQQLQLSRPGLRNTRRFSQCRCSQSAQLAATIIAALISPSLALGPFYHLFPPVDPGLGISRTMGKIDVVNLSFYFLFFIFLRIRTPYGYRLRLF